MIDSIFVSAIVFRQYKKLLIATEKFHSQNFAIFRYFLLISLFQFHSCNLKRLELFLIYEDQFIKMIGVSHSFRQYKKLLNATEKFYLQNLATFSHFLFSLFQFNLHNLKSLGLFLMLSCRVNSGTFISRMTSDLNTFSSIAFWIVFSFEI